MARFWNSPALCQRSTGRCRAFDGGPLGLILSRMTLPKEAELLSSSSGELEIKHSGASTVVTLSTEGQRKLSTLISGANAKSSSVYLGLEKVLGTFDAAVLNVYINLPENSHAAEYHKYFAES